eukprot:2978581-Amphidinium_carterae.1
MTEVSKAITTGLFANAKATNKMGAVADKSTDKTTGVDDLSKQQVHQYSLCDAARWSFRPAWQTIFAWNFEGMLDHDGRPAV